MTQKQKIVPHLWFDKEANEAAEFYVSAFGRPSKILNKTTNPSVSFFVNFDASKQDNTRKNLDRLWDKLIDGGKALMELGEYPFSKHYGWLQDKYGISWQIIPWGMQKLMENKDQKKVDRVTWAFLQMKKIDLEKLEKA